MLKYLGLALILLFPLASFCEIDCEKISIKKEYNRSDYVFYGKFIGTDTFTNYHSINRYPTMVDNFEVIRLYKDHLTYFTNYRLPKNQNGNYLISIKSFCLEDPDRYSPCFDKGKYYLVYAYSYENELHTVICTRTREIIKENFKVNTAFPEFILDEIDNEKDEDLELKKLSQQEQASLKDSMPIPEPILTEEEFKIKQLKDINLSFRKKLEEQNYKIIILAILLGISLILMVYLWIKKR